MAAFNEARKVFVWAIRLRHLAIVFLEPRLHLEEQRFLQRFRIDEFDVGVGVLGFEVGADVGRKRLRLAHDLLPVRGAQPGIIVSERDAVMDRGHRFAARQGRADLFVRRNLIGRSGGDRRGHDLGRPFIGKRMALHGFFTR